MPFGAKPPCAVRLVVLGATPGHRPRTYTPASSKKTTIAATLIEANQNSNSPYDLTEMRFVTVIDSNNAKLMIHAGACGSQKRTNPAAATASSATTMTQKYQYIQPVRNPANSPTRGRSLQATRAYS